MNRRGHIHKSMAKETAVADGAARTRSAMLGLTAGLGFALATMAAAHMKLWLPFTPVPVTMQTLVVLLAGLCLGKSWGGLSQAKYLTLGFLGLPAFAGGLAALAAPSGGYLVGFVAAAVIAGGIYSALRSTLGAILACLAGTAVIYLCGCLWLVVLTGGSMPEVLALGVAPFLPGDVLKIAAAVLLVRGPYTGPRLARAFEGLTDNQR